jgi:hypothetical protein
MTFFSKKTTWKHFQFIKQYKVLSMTVTIERTKGLSELPCCYLGQFGWCDEFILTFLINHFKWHTFNVNLQIERRKKTWKIFPFQLMMICIFIARDIIPKHDCRRDWRLVCSAENRTAETGTAFHLSRTLRRGGGGEVYGIGTSPSSLYLFYSDVTCTHSR